MSFFVQLLNKMNSARTRYYNMSNILAKALLYELLSMNIRNKPFFEMVVQIKVINLRLCAALLPNKVGLVKIHRIYGRMLRFRRILKNKLKKIR